MDVRMLNPQLKAGKVRTSTTGVILHSSAGSTLEGCITTLRRRNEIGIGYHYVIDLDGTVWKLCSSTKTIGHAGESVGWDGAHCNRYTIGVCFINPNDGVTRITAAQEHSCVELLKDLDAAYGGELRLSTHYGVSYPRKTDPKTVDARGIAKKAGLLYWAGRRGD